MRHVIRFPALRSVGTSAHRTSFSLLRRNGDDCRRGEPIAFCLVVAEPAERRGGEPHFKKHKEDIFAIILAPTSGRISWDSAISRGSWVDALTSVDPIQWQGECELGSIECDEGCFEAPIEPEDGLILTLGSRLVEWGDARGGILPGWYDEFRSWRFRGPLSSLAISSTCSLRFAVLGEQRTAHQILLDTPHPVHLAYYSETLLVPAVDCVLEEILRTPAERENIVAEVSSWLRLLEGDDATQGTAFVALLMDRLRSGSPLFRQQRVLQQDGLKVLPAASSVVLSTASEEGMLLRHKKLPLTLCFPKLLNIPKPVLKVLEDTCTLIPSRTADELRVSYQQLSRIFTERGCKLFVTNSFVSEPGLPLLRPAWAGNLSKVFSYRMRLLNNALLHLQEKGYLTVVDIDHAIASIGGYHMPDGAHGDREIERQIRRELVERLRYPT